MLPETKNVLKKIMADLFKCPPFQIPSGEVMMSLAQNHLSIFPSASAYLFLPIAVTDSCLCEGFYGE